MKIPHFRVILFNINFFLKIVTPYNRIWLIWVRMVRVGVSFRVTMRAESESTKNRQKFPMKYKFDIRF